MAESEFIKAINDLEKRNDNTYPCVYAELGQLYILKNQYELALKNLNKALENPNLNKNDRIKALAFRIITFANLQMEVKGLIDIEEYKHIDPDFSKLEYTKEYVFVRNINDNNLIKIFCASPNLHQEDAYFQFTDRGVNLISP